VPSRNVVLRSLGPAIEALRPHLASETFKAGQVIKEDDAEIDRVFFPTGGLISSRVVLRSGDELECAIIGSNSAAGLLAALGLPHGWARFVCLTDGHAWTIALPRLASAMRSVLTIERQLNRFCIAQVGYTAHLGVCNAMHSAEERLARWLATATDLLGQTDIAVTQDELANILGLQRSAVNPALQKLKAGGLVDIARGRVCILDAGRLSRRACECLPVLSRALRVGHQLLDQNVGEAAA
jgi:CRP-like cAMP-binding protein